MRIATLTIVLALAAACVLSPAPGAARAAQGQQATPTRPTERLGWLAGCWERRTPSALIEEQWMAPRGGALMGMSRTTRGDSVVEYETLRIYEAGDTLVYAAQPSRQAPAEFRGAAPADGEVVFENLGHDFPQRIIYRRVGPDSLLARIEGMRGDRLRGIDFPFRRVRCPGERG